VGGACICTADSCADGCCNDAEQCITDTSLEACGAGGAACTTCDALSADTCSEDGTCACGDDPACPDGQTCVDGTCQCENTETSNVLVNGTPFEGTPITVSPGATVSLAFDYSLTQLCDDGEGPCDVQLVVGLGTLGYGYEAMGCGYGGVPSACPARTEGSASELSFVAPRSPGVYQIRALQALTSSCEEGMEEFNSQRGYTEHVVATIRIDQTCSSGLNNLHTLRLNGGNSEATVAPGSTVNYRVQYNVVRVNGCPACFLELPFGLINANGEGNPNALDCAFIGGGGVCPGPRSGVDDGSFTAPTTPGVYHLRWRLALEYNCRDARTAFNNNPPGRSNTAGVLYVE
jgi:hypothetical protein